MDRQEYLNLRKNNYTLNILYDYYNIHNKKSNLSMDINEFNHYITQYLNKLSAYVDRIIENVYRYYEDKFKIIKVIDLQGNLILL